MANMRVMYEGELHTVLMETNVGDLKSCLADMLDLPLHALVLSCHGTVLDDALSAERFEHETLHLSLLPEASANMLGLGAGGSIVQAIKPDLNSPRIWDVASAKLLNIQIVDSETFRRVTGLDPPATPITAQTYQQMGLPFFQFSGCHEHSGDGVAGTWGPGLVGVAEAAAAAAAAAKPAKRKRGSKGGRKQDTGAQWGLLASGMWGRLPNADDAGTGRRGRKAVGRSEVRNRFEEEGVDLPVVLLDVDPSLPRFRSVLDWDDGWGY